MNEVNKIAINKQNFNKLIVGFIGETLRWKSLVGKNFNESLAIHQIHQCQTFVLCSS